MISKRETKQQQQQQQQQQLLSGATAPAYSKLTARITNKKFRGVTHPPFRSPQFRPENPTRLEDPSLDVKNETQTTPLIMVDKVLPPDCGCPPLPSRGEACTLLPYLLCGASSVVHAASVGRIVCFASRTAACCLGRPPHFICSGVEVVLQACRRELLDELQYNR